MTGARRIWALPLALVLALVTLAGRPIAAHAQGSAARGDSTALVAERQRVRADLERANADVDALKRRDRSLRDDYRLRARLADAEALARQLTSLDARLGASPTASTPAAAVEPRVSSTDGPAEIDAKADILADQARRLSARADTLLGRASDLRARQTLRRRVGQMERDPFSPLEGSKRRAMTAGIASTQASAARPPTTVAAQTPGGAPSPMTPGSTTLSTPNPGGGQADLSPTGAGATSASAHPGEPVSTTTTPTTGTSGSGVALTSPKAAPAPAGTTSTSDGVSLSAQLRDLLDPTTLAEIQRIEATGGASSGLDALERAGAALKARAARLDAEAAALRAAEHAPPRAR
jgi:hypothetical protein